MSVIEQEPDRPTIQELKPKMNGPAWGNEAAVDAALMFLDQTVEGWEDAHDFIREEAILRGEINYSQMQTFAAQLVDVWNECQELPMSIEGAEGVLHPVDASVLALPAQNPGATITWWVQGGGDPGGFIFTCAGIIA